MALQLAPASVLANAIAPEEQQVQRVRASNDLAFLWHTNSIPGEVQARLAQLGFRDLVQFANLESVPEEARKFSKGELGLLIDVNPEYRALVGLLMQVWGAAKVRGTRPNARNADLHVGDLPRRLSKKHHNYLIRAYNLAIGQILQDREIPASATTNQTLKLRMATSSLKG